MSDSIFVGIDVSTKSNKVCILDQQGNRLSKLSVENNSHGSARIVERVIEAIENQILLCVLWSGSHIRIR
jgi:sugar (pentulose or hexulose) kinase